MLAALARRLNAPAPALLALAGAGLALLPVSVPIRLDPSLALALFVAPVLLDSSYDASPRDLKENIRPILGLVFVAVGLTTAGVAWLARLMVPDMPWAATIALGAIVAPPDAAAASAILRQIGLPHRILVILEGESLLNDATALLIYRLAVGAVTAESVSIATIAPTFLLVVAGGALLGIVLSRLWSRLLAFFTDPPSAVVLQFVGTFGTWLIADQLGVSPIIAVVANGITTARTAPRRTGAALRIPTYAVWETVVFVLQVLAFILIGFQLRPILVELGPAERRSYLAIALAVLGAVILIRLVWVMAYNAVIRWKNRRFGVKTPRPMLPPTVRGGLIVSWCGMRGIVTLAAAYALPERFPYRDLILLCAFAVVLGTLVLQGLTLRPLVKWFDLRDDSPVDREFAQARTAALEAALAAIDGDESTAAHSLRKEYRAALAEGPETGDTAHNQLRRHALAAARETSYRLRQSGEIGDDAFHRIEEELDRMEMSALPREGT